MANIENLNFEVILNDTDFQKRVNTDIKLAQELDASLSKILMMRTNAKPIISTVGVKNAQQLSQLLDEIRQKYESIPKGSVFVGDAEKLNGTLEKTNATIDQMAAKQNAYTGAVKGSNTALLNTRNLLRTLSMLTGTAFSVIGIRRFLSSLIRITGEFEVQRMALRSMLKDIDGADKIFEDLYRFSSDSTYRFSELAKYAKQLAGFQIGKNDLLETTKMLGDVASGLGTSMDRLILAYGHVKSSGFLRGIQLRSFSQNGVPILKELSDMFTEIEGKAVSMGDIFDKMTKREIPFEMVEEAFRRMTSEGGQFYKMQETLAQTLSGQINILKGRWENMMAAIGESNSGVLKGAVENISELILHHEKLGKIIGELIAVWGAYKAATIAVALAHGNLAVITDTRLYRSLLNITKWIATNPWAIMAAAVTLLTIEIIKSSKELSDHERIIKSLEDVTDKYNDSINTEIGELDALYGALRNAKEGTEEYDLAKRAIQKRFNPYIDKLREEGVAVDNLASIYDRLAEKVINANKQKFLEQAQDALGDEYAKAQQNIETRTKRVIADMGKLTADQEQAIRHYIRTGEMTEYFKSIANIDARRTPGPYENSYQTAEDRKSFRERLSELRLEYDRDTMVFQESMLEAAKRFDAVVEETTGKTTETLKGWRRAVQTALYTVDDKFEKTFMPKDDEDYYEFLERMGKHYKEVNEQKDKALQKDKHIYEQELDAIRKVDAALEGNILSDVRYNKTPWKGGSSSSSTNPFADKISDTRASIALLEKYKAAYEKLEPILGEEGARKWVSKEMGYDVENLNNDLEALIARLRTFGDEGIEAADAAEARLGLDKASKAVKEYNAAKKALEAYEKAVAKFDKDWGDGEASGAAYRVQKAVRDYNNEDKKIEEDWIAVKEAAAAANKEETESLKENYEARKKANLSKFRETIRGLADDIFKEQMAGFDLTNWGDKSISQIREIAKAVKEVKVPDDIKEMLDPETLKLLEDELGEIANKLLNRTISPEQQKKLIKNVKLAAGEILDLADSFEKLGEAMGDVNMQEAAKSISALGDFAQSAAQGFAQGGIFGAIIGSVASLGKTILSELTESQQESAKTAQALKDAAVAYEEAADAMAIASHESIFGVDGVDQFREYVRIMEKYKKTVSDFYDMLRAEADENGGGLGAYLLGQYTDANGEMDLERLKADIEAGVVSGVDDIADAIDKYKEALKEVDGVIESVFGDIASSAADQIVDSWIAASSAALDYADILDDVARAYSKMLVQSVIMETALDPITADLKKAFTEGRYNDAMSMVAGAMQTIQDSAPIYEQILQAFDPYFKRSESGEGGSSLGSGIKSITEDTANLLASYLNAIRADVSYMRVMQEKSLEGVTALSGNLPTLNDYLAQISATNFDIAQATQSMLSEMRSVIGAPGTSGMVVRVESY